MDDDTKVRRLRRAHRAHEVTDRMLALADRRREVPASIAAAELSETADRGNSLIAEMESNFIRVVACWDGDLDGIGSFSQLGYLHEKVSRVEEAARELRLLIERVTDRHSIRT